MKVTIYLNEPQIIEKVTSNRFGMFVSVQWQRLINPYTPKDTGMLLGTTLWRPFEIEYVQPYSNYMYEGILYVDPETGSSWADFGDKKVPTEKLLEYQKNNPFATDHWDIKAAEAGQLNKLYRTINAGLASGRF